MLSGTVVIFGNNINKKLLMELFEPGRWNVLERLFKCDLHVITEYEHPSIGQIANMDVQIHLVLYRVIL